MYPAGYATYVDVEGLTETLCGASRPGHFRGVTTVVTKLFNIVAPDVALFGCKDFQQLAVIRCMSADLNLPVEIVGMPIVREPDGLALSSRNVYLSPGQRQQALVLSQGIARARELAGSGVESVGEILAVLRALIEEQTEARIDYLQICHQQTLQEQERLEADSVLLMAVFIGKTRLLDNALLFSRD
jgi:pantoate--beta-alanine ligase